MSGLRTPPVVAVNYDCRICGSQMWIAKSCLDKYECDGQPLELMHPVDGVPTRCSACVRIGQAVLELNNLVIRNPYLVTDGMAAAPPKSDWEKDTPDIRKTFDWDNSQDGSAGDGMTIKEREAFQEKIIRSFVETAGQGLTEDEVYGKDALRDGRESRASTQVDDERSSETDWDCKTETDGEAMGDSGMEKER